MSVGTYRSDCTKVKSDRVEELPPKQLRMLLVIAAVWRTCGHSPTLADLRKMNATPGSAKAQLLAKGLIRVEYFTTRTIYSLTPKAWAQLVGSKRRAA